MSDPHLHEQFVALLRDYGDLAIFVALLLESCGLPLPGELMLISGGTLAARGDLDPTMFFLAAFAAAVIGDNIGYVIGRYLGRRTIIAYGSHVGITAERYDWAEAQFQRFGPFVVAMARFVTILRQINGIVAGSLGMHWFRFFCFNALGAALWVGFWGVIAMFLGRYLAVFLSMVHGVGLAGGLIACLGLAGVVVWKWSRGKSRADS